MQMQLTMPMTLCWPIYSSSCGGIPPVALALAVSLLDGDGSDETLSVSSSPVTLVEAGDDELLLLLGLGALGDFFFSSLKTWNTYQHRFRDSETHGHL